MSSTEQDDGEETQSTVSGILVCSEGGATGLEGNMGCCSGAMNGVR